MPQQALEIRDYDGGITDNYLDCAPNEYKTADNLLIKDNKKFETRYGTGIYSSTMYQAPSGNQRIGAFVLFDDTQFTQSARDLFYQNVTWQTLTGPTSNKALAAGGVSNYLSHAEWNKHLIVTTDAFGSPQKIYQDNTGTFQVRNGGVPKITQTACIALANNLKSQFNLHFASHGIHAHADTIDQISTVDAFDLPSLIALTTVLTGCYTAHNADANLASAWAYHIAQQSGTKLLASSTVVQTLADVKIRLDDIKSKYNSHDAGNTAHNTGSTFQVAKYSEPQIASAGGTGSNFIYTFVPYYEYFVGSVLFIDEGATHQITLLNAGAPDSNTVSITQIPVITNGTTENYDTSNIKWKIYRTAANGTTSYLTGSVTNGTTTYSDTMSDTTLQAVVEQIYTAGGVLDNDLPPQAKFVVVANDICWYAHVKEGSEVNKSRVKQSSKFDPDSVPGANYVDLEDEITGMGYVGIYPIAFCKKRIYRLEGFFDDQGNGQIDKREIARTIGSINHQSIVNTLSGCFFATEAGFYFTDGFTVVKVSHNFDTRYKALVATATQKARIYGEYDVTNSRIYWCCTSESTASENDIIYVLDLKWGIRPLPNSTDFANATFTNIVPSSLTWKPCCLGFDASGNFVIGDSRGYLFEFDQNKFSDPIVNTAANPSTWGTSAIVWDHEGPAFSFGTSDQKKIALWCTTVLDNQSNVSLQIGSKSDDSGVFTALKEIRFRGNITWRDIDAPSWRPDPDGYKWRIFPILIEKRRFPSRPNRFLYKQIQVTNSFTNIARSDDFGTALVNKGGSTATLNTYPTISWPTDLIEYYISFESDGYVTNYAILTRTANILTFSDSTKNAADAATSKWLIRGVRKNERLNLISYSISWELLTASHRPYRGDIGENS